MLQVMGEKSGCGSSFKFQQRESPGGEERLGNSGRQAVFWGKLRVP